MGLLFDTLKEILHKTDPTGIAIPILMISPINAKISRIKKAGRVITSQNIKQKK